MRQALIKHCNNIKTSVMEYILRSNITEMGTCLNSLDLVYDVTIDLFCIIFRICFNQQNCMITCLNLIYYFYSYRRTPNFSRDKKLLHVFWNTLSTCKHDKTFYLIWYLHVESKHRTCAHLCYLYNIDILQYVTCNIHLKENCGDTSS